MVLRKKEENRKQNLLCLYNLHPVSTPPYSEYYYYYYVSRIFYSPPPSPLPDKQRITPDDDIQLSHASCYCILPNRGYRARDPVSVELYC